MIIPQTIIVACKKHNTILPVVGRFSEGPEIVLEINPCPRCLAEVKIMPSTAESGGDV